jgi:hypothetical protein
MTTMKALRFEKYGGQLRAGFEDGHLRASPVQRWSLDQAVDAYTAVENRMSLNKHVFLPRGT